MGSYQFTDNKISDAGACFYNVLFFLTDAIVNITSNTRFIHFKMVKDGPKLET